MKGKVSLVGAGPGDPELLTLKALKAIRGADAVLYDDLVSPEILALAPQSAQLHNVGKRCGSKKITQEEINFLMTTLADGGMRVVRLKSGDPLIFGRAGEEMEVLRSAGIECEIIPGITSALGAAAAAGIPLTHRKLASTVILVTAQQASSNTTYEWKTLVSNRATLAIYMPGENHSALAQRLKAAGLSPETPCALISHATQPGQRIAISTLAQLADENALPSPSLLIIGEVVRFAEFWRTAPMPAGWLNNHLASHALRTLQHGSISNVKEQAA
jgi:uroporphyrin-III C-methyltransferase